MSDTTGGEAEVIQFEDLTFDEAVAFAQEVYGFPESWAVTFVCIERGIDQEGPIEVAPEVEG